MTEDNLFYHNYASFTNAEIPQLKVAALYFNKLVILDPGGESWASIGADYPDRKAVKQSQDAGILQTVAPSDVLGKYEGSMTDAIRLNMRD